MKIRIAPLQVDRIDGLEAFLRKGDRRGLPIGFKLCEAPGTDDDAAHVGARVGPGLRIKTIQTFCKIETTWGGDVEREQCRRMNQESALIQLKTSRFPIR